MLLQFVVGGTADYENRLRTSKFCMTPYGHGWGEFGAAV